MKAILVTIIFAAGLIGGTVFLTARSDDSPAAKQNVTMVDGTQIIEITAKGGFQPRRTIAQAGIPTILRFKTSGTFDCSASVRIPSMNYSKLLPQSGTTDVSLGNPEVSTLQGMCGMGMYRFEIAFRN